MLLALSSLMASVVIFFFQAEDGIRDWSVTGVQTCALPISFLDEGLQMQAGFNLAALEQAIGRSVDNREDLLAQQHQAGRWTYIGSAMVHERFKASLESLSPNSAARIAEAAPLFA